MIVDAHLAMPTLYVVSSSKKGRRIAPPAPMLCGGGGLDHHGAAQAIKERKAINRGTGAIQRAHGAGEAQGDHLGMVYRLAFRFTGKNIDHSDITLSSLSWRPWSRHRGEESWHDRSFLTLGADHSTAVISNDKALPILLSSEKFILKNRRILAMSSKIMRLQRVLKKRAMRKRSSLPSPVANACAVPPYFFLSLTPARWGANRLARQFLAPIRARGAVLDRTALEPFQNRQVIEIIGQFSRFSRFSRARVLHVRGRARMRLRVCGEFGNHRTIEPNEYSYIYQLVSGSVAVLVRFCLEPLVDGQAIGRRNARFSNKIEGGYCSADRGWLLMTAFKGLSRHRGREKFGDLRARIGAAVPALPLDGSRGEMAENCDFWRLAFLSWKARVGRVVQKPHKTVCFARCAPAYQAGGEGGGMHIASRDPLPPSPTRDFPRSLARQTGQILFRIVDHTPLEGVSDQISEIGLKSKSQTGPGESVLASVCVLHRWAGAHNDFVKKRQRDQVNIGGCYVN